jgi:hypothetical protein
MPFLLSAFDNVDLPRLLLRAREGWDGVIRIGRRWALPHPDPPLLQARAGSQRDMSADNVGDSSNNVVEIAAIQRGHANTAGADRVNRMFFAQTIYLRFA